MVTLAMPLFEHTDIQSLISRLHASFPFDAVAAYKMCRLSKSLRFTSLHPVALVQADTQSTGQRTRKYSDQSQARIRKPPSMTGHNPEIAHGVENAPQTLFL